MKRIFSIKSADVFIEKSNPPKLLVTAEGTVSSLGWTRPNLSRVTYVVFPADGIQEYEFLAEPPGGIAGDQMKDISASCESLDIPDKLKGVRILSTTNKIEALL